MSRQDDLAPEHAVLVFDMAHQGTSDGDRMIHGFRGLEQARAYAEARTRSSVEELRKPGISDSELTSLWYIYGEDCAVVGDSFRGHENLASYIANPATDVQCNWTALAPQPRRFYAALLFMDAASQTTWLLRFFRRTSRANRAELVEMFGDDARAALAAKGIAVVEPLDLTTASHFELRDPPAPPMATAAEFRNWQLTVGFVCHDIKFGATGRGVFAWPGEPEGAELGAMVNVIVGDCLAVRGDGPDWLDVTDIISIRVEETAAEPDIPAT